MNHTLIKSGTILQQGERVTRDVLIGVDGNIERIAKDIEAPHADKIDATGCLLFPLLTDCHVHFREPGLEHKSTMLSEGKAALSGGIGTVCEMPNTIPPTVTIEALADKVKRGSHVDHLTMKFFFGITERAHLEELKKLFESKDVETKMLRRHVAGVKLYLDHSTGDQKVASELLDDIFALCTSIDLTIVAHCEDPEMNAKAATEFPSGDVSLHSKRRPAASEVHAIQQAITLAEKHGTHVHIAHLSTEGGAEAVRAAKKKSVRVTAEAAPHHLFLTTDDYASLGTFGKMNPPLRSIKDRDALWVGLADGTIDCVATDHAPHTKEEKQTGDPLSAPSGVPGVELMIPLLLTVAAGSWPHPHSQKPAVTLSYAEILRVCGENPARIFHLTQDVLEEGAKARITLIDEKATNTVSAGSLLSACGWSPYDGWSLVGKVKQIIV